jgi:hypothetical protein
MPLSESLYMIVQKIAATMSDHRKTSNAEPLNNGVISSQVCESTENSYNCSGVRKEKKAGERDA